jgi:ferredoxin
VKVRVDADQCMGHGMCKALVPEVFEVDAESGFNEMGEFEVPNGQRAAVERGVSGCPERAISIIGDTT